MRVMFVFLVTLLTTPSVARACSCDDPAPPADAIEAADAVVEARLVSREEEPVYEEWEDGNGDIVQEHVYDLYTFEFEVEVAWKGSPEVGDTITLQADGDCCACQLIYTRVGSDWLLYLSEHNGGWSDGGTCGRTRNLANAECDLATLNGDPLLCDERGDPVDCQGCSAASGPSLLTLLVLLRRRNRAAPTAINPT